MSDLEPFFGPNAGYVLELYDRYRQNPDAVDPESRALFAGWNPERIAAADFSAPAAPPSASSAAMPCSEADVARINAVSRLARFVRIRGHLAARVDPLGLQESLHTELELSDHNLTTADLMRVPASVVGGPCAQGAANALEAIGRLRQVYSGAIGYDDEHIANADERHWLRDAAESQEFFQGIDTARKRDVLERLTAVETFENFLHRTYTGAKRFSIEGTDILVPVLDEIVRLAAGTQTQEVVFGMAHRGRLNVLAHILGKPYKTILGEFEAASKLDESGSKGPQGGTGDVKYHLGFRGEYRVSDARSITLTLVPNPSHLEYVNPVVEGHTRAAQERRTERGRPSQDISASLAVLIHGDAAFPGQGIVAETLNLSRLPGYQTGGTIHIIVNNQVGFTTVPSDARSTLYASDLAKGFEIPIVHVNADDPIACLAVTRMAHAYRERFHKDFLIDLVGYRRYGHNESDEPRFTQPRMYAAVDALPRVREQWAKTLEKDGLVTRDEAEAMIAAVQKQLQESLQTARQKPVGLGPSETDAGTRSPQSRPVETVVDANRLVELNEALLVRPDGFTDDAKLESILLRRRDLLEQSGGINWGHAETLAFAAILADGVPIRLTGQDSERGTFGQRSLVLHDVTNGDQYTALQALPQARASFAVFNSPLSENAALGFEYGYSMHAPGVLVLWEAQYGDFANGAQVIIDQFLVSGNAKWRQIPSLVMLLPHGYEGNGPEHSSARLERFLQLAAADNIRVVNCTTSGQYFHLLRRQAALLQSDARPLIVMSPKALLRHPRAGSSLADLSTGAFQSVIDDADARVRAESVTRLVLCSGKVYVDLVGTEAYKTAAQVAVARVEELYPFPAERLREVIAGYPNLRELVWLQEEPRNMGAWNFIAPRLRDEAVWQGETRYVGREAAASPAEGSKARADARQAEILAEALADAPTLLALERQPVKTNGRRNGNSPVLTGEKASENVVADVL